MVGGDWTYHFDCTSFTGAGAKSGLREAHHVSHMDRVHELTRQIRNKAAWKCGDPRPLIYECYPIWEELGRALHPAQDVFSHQASHHADTPLKHITGPNAKDVHRPDNMHVWVTDAKKARDVTKETIEHFLEIKCNPCVTRR